MLISSLVVFLYLIFVIAPYANKNGFFNENGIPNQVDITKYKIMLYPVIIGYTILASIYVNKISFFKSLSVPLYLSNIYVGFCLCLIEAGGALLWIMVPTIIFPIIAIPVSFINGFIKDYKYIKKVRKNNNK